MKYGAIGNVVNIAARLEHANKALNTDILFSRSVFVALPESITSEVTEQVGPYSRAIETTTRRTSPPVSESPVSAQPRDLRRRERLRSRSTPSTG